MFTTFLKQLKPALLLFVWLSVLTGLAYPLLVTGLGRVFWPDQARGSLIVQDGEVRGSRLIGQSFASERYFHGRPSVTLPFPYNAAGSMGSNLAPSNPALRDLVTQRSALLRSRYNVEPMPMDLVTASASGLDPHISPEAAAYQVERVARARGLSPQAVAALVEQHTQGPLWGFWGEARVNVLILNLALDTAVNVQ